MQPKSHATQRQLDARAIAANPQPHHSASLRLLAWATLKAARGQTICQHRLHRAGKAVPA